MSIGARRALAAFISALILGACRDAHPTGPKEVSMSGTWTGSYRPVTCGFGTQPCSGLQESYPIRVVIEQRGTEVTGAFTADVPWGSVNGSIPVTGSVESSQTLHIQGAQPFEPNGTQAGIEISNWTTVLGDSGASLSGTFRLLIMVRTNNVFPSALAVNSNVSLRR